MKSLWEIRHKYTHAYCIKVQEQVLFRYKTWMQVLGKCTVIMKYTLRIKDGFTIVWGFELHEIL